MLRTCDNQSFNVVFPLLPVIHITLNLVHQNRQLVVIQVVTIHFTFQQAVLGHQVHTQESTQVVFQDQEHTTVVHHLS